VEEVKKRLVFTTHTPEEAGNEKHDILLCHKMSYFCGMHIDDVRKITGMEDDLFNHSLAALRFAKLANGVSKLHAEVSRKMWNKYTGICEIKAITNGSIGQTNSCTRPKWMAMMFGSTTGKDF
jgi:starch phosphorylase